MSDDTDIILPSDDRAATYRTDITGWVSRDGKYCGDDERLARLVGATHRACADCGVSTLKTYMICPACRDKRAEQRYLALPQAEWDGEAMRGWTAADLHEFFLIDHFGSEVHELFGKKRLKPLRRSSRLSKMEFADYIDHIQRFMAERGVFIPDPDPEWMLKEQAA